MDMNQHGRGEGGRPNMDPFIRCKKCYYTSDRENLYEEVSRSRRGRRNAQLNVAMAVGHCGTSLTKQCIHGILLSANIEPASSTNMHQTCNKMGKIITNVTKTSINKIRQNFQYLNKKCKLPETPIRAEGSAQYNNTTFLPSRKFHSELPHNWHTPE